VKDKELNKNISMLLHYAETILRHLIAKLLQGLAIFIVVGIPLLLLVVHFHGLG